MADSGQPLRSNFQVGEQDLYSSSESVERARSQLVPSLSLLWTLPLLAVISWKICNGIPETGLDDWLRHAVKGEKPSRPGKRDAEEESNIVQRINLVLALIYIGWLTIVLRARAVMRSHEVLKIVEEVKRYPTLCKDIINSIDRCRIYCWTFLVLLPMVANMPILFLEDSPYNIYEFGYRILMNMLLLSPVLSKFSPAVLCILKLCDAQLDIFIAQAMRREELEDQGRVSEMRPTVVGLMRSGVFRTSSSWKNFCSEHIRMSLAIDQVWHLRRAGGLLLIPVLLLVAEVVLHIDSYRLRGGHDQVLRFVFCISVVCTALYPVASFNARCESYKASHGYRAYAVRAVVHRYVDETRSLEEQAIYMHFLQYLDTSRLGIKMGAVRITTGFIMSVFFKLGVIGSTMLQLMLQLLDVNARRHSP